MSLNSHLIKSHIELANHIVGSKVLHLNSFGKDSIACLEWLNYAMADVVSINLTFLAPHPKDKIYLNYLKKRYSHFTFIQENQPLELNKIAKGIYQSPIELLTDINKWEHYEFSVEKLINEYKEKFNCQYICSGQSKYESVTRASGFYKRGLLQGNTIYPLGLLTKEQVLNMARKAKLHPVYKDSPGTLDFPSYYKMRKAFKRFPDYEKQVFTTYPLLELDKFRYEKLIKFRK